MRFNRRAQLAENNEPKSKQRTKPTKKGRNFLTKKARELFVPFSEIVLPKTTPFSAHDTIFPNEHLEPQTRFRTSDQTLQLPTTGHPYPFFSGNKLLQTHKTILTFWHRHF